MAIYNPPMTDILAAIAAQNNGLQLVQSQYNIGNPVPMGNPTQNLNTELTFTAKVPDSPYQGAVTCRYKRLNLADLATLIPITLRLNGATTVMDVANYLNTRYGLNFVPSDLVDGALNLTDGAGTVTLTAQANSLGWIGSVTLNILKGYYDFGALATTTSLPGLLYPQRDITKPFGETYSYWRDFTNQQSALDALVVADNNVQAMAAILTAITGDQWKYDVQNRFSLLNATILHKGPTDTPFVNGSDTLTFNTDYTSVVVVRLGDGSLSYNGYLICHYGVPTDGFDD